MHISPLPERDLQQALDLALGVFMQFEAPDYSPQGIETFQQFLINAEAVSALRIYGAYEAERLVGMLATRGEDGAHIALFFVDAAFQGRGIGRALFDLAHRNCHSDRMSVNSSPYAVHIYEHLGFTAVCDEQVTDGIRFTPMRYVKAQEDNARSSTSA